MPKRAITAKSFFGLIGDDGYLNEDGAHLLVGLVQRLKPGQWGEAFIPLKKCGVHCAIELVVIREKKVLLVWRDDEHFTGWHTPGSYLDQGESWQDVATRCARKELGVDVTVIKDLKTFNNTDNLRFHDETILLLCCLMGDEPTAGQWFDECPPNLIYPHKKYWPEIAALISPFEVNVHFSV